MIVVAITRLAGPIEQEAIAVAADLGSAAYDERLNLNAGIPAVMLATTDEERARALLARIRSRKHEAVLCRVDDLISDDKMIAPRHFALDERALSDTDHPGTHLPWSEIGVMVRATLQQSRETHQVVKEKKFDVGRALISGGLVMSKTVTHDVTTTKHQRDDVLYLFAREARTPWIIRAERTDYSPLGRSLAPTARANFLALVALLRERAPAAPYDERLLAFRVVPERARRAAATALHTSFDPGTDLLAQLVNASLRGPT